jgi:biotin/methionine sulfoxide reductase
VVRIFNEVGACLATARLDAGIRVDVVQLPTGAWYDPQVGTAGDVLCIHGNPNVLTRDIGTSALAQGCSGQLSTVDIVRHEGALPPLRCFDPPAVAATSAAEWVENALGRMRSR